MKNTPASITSALGQDVLRPYLILDMEFTTGTVRLTNLAYDITVDSNVYLSDGGLTEFSPPQLTSVLDREVYRIKLVDHGNTYKNYFESGVLGTPVTVRLGIEGNLTDFDILYKGRIDATFIETESSEYTKHAIIECSSPFGALDRTTDRRTEKNTQRQINSSDSAFDRIYNSADEITLKWGKK